MNLTLWCLTWASFSVLVSLLMSLSGKRNSQTVCIVCGRVIDGPGICAGCAADTEETDRVLLVRQVAPEYTVINPDDLRD